MNIKNLFHYKSFAVIGISRTEHGVALVRHLLQAGLFPKFALISAATDEQLERSKPYWPLAEWWTNGTGHVLNQSTKLLPEKGDFLIESIYLSYKIPYLFVPGFNSDITIDILSRGEVDAVLLAETSILKNDILRSVPGGFVNIHAAPLPEYRGNDATYWALYHDDPLFVTAHCVDKGIDTGPILGKKSLPVRKGDTLKDISQRGIDICGQLATEVFIQALQSGVRCLPQSAWQGTTFRGPMPIPIIEECERRLREQEYTHYE